MEGNFHNKTKKQTFFIYGMYYKTNTKHSLLIHDEPPNWP